MTRPAPLAGLALPAFGPLPHPRGGLVGRLSRLLALRRSRRSLGELGADRLRDLGLTRSQALLEAQRPFWDAPDQWLR